MQHDPREYKVNVSGEICSVLVHQRSKSVWVAVGEYMGERIETKDSSASTALKRWQEAANFIGN